MFPVPGAMIQVQQHAARVLATQGVTAKLHWRTVNRPEGYDRNDETTLGDDTVATDHSRDFKTLFHLVDHRLSGFQRHAEIQTGDVILDYLEDLGLDGKEDARIEVNGRLYVQKSIGRGLKEAWDAYLGLGGTMRTLLLSPAA